MNTLYWLESDVITIACSFLSCMNTGDLNVNVVGLEASDDVNTSSASNTTFENGNTVCVGVPFSTVLISTATGISGSLVKKNKSSLVKNTPPSSAESSTRKVCARGSTHLVSSVSSTETLVSVLASFICSDVTLAFLTDMIVSCVVCRIPDEVNSTSPLLSDTPGTLLSPAESLNLNSLVPVLNFCTPCLLGLSIKNDPLSFPFLSVIKSLLDTFAIAPDVSPII